MDHEGREHARRWLAEQGVTQIGEGVWIDEESADERLTANEVAHAWTGAVLEDPDLDAAGRLRLALGLLDLLDDYWVTCEIRFAFADAQDPVRAELLWDAYRRRLEAPEQAEPITYSLWVDWFEDRATVEVAFAEVLGNDVEELQARDRLHEMVRDPLFRRAKRVLEISGPVPWPIKHPVYQAGVALPDLHLALFKGLLSSYHDVYGDLEPHAAHALLQRLDLPEDTEHLVRLRTVLEAGHSNHYLTPDAWPTAENDTSKRAHGCDQGRS
ncbi:hypothetical protein [Streptosporangium lutulentum]|uniref:Uncharacterized protein n=1 Tax=Streptosporangium lutulentum TaxID=1461250 RepID=A0ABT9Q520_9ACTN|nr:hypothetical protein [Streptosporangium lutulentum]MDP9841476.1 hypothetical protein [Streptosporangium lutulentum]